MDPNQPTPNPNTSQPVDLAAGVSATPNSTPIPVSTPGFNPISAANETAAQADSTVNPSMNLLSTDPGGATQEVQGAAATPEGMQISVPAEEPALEPLVNSTPEATADFMTPPAPEPEPTPEPVTAEAVPVDVAADMSAIAPTPDTPPAMPTSGTMPFQTPLQSQSEIVNPGVGDAPPEEPPSEQPSSGAFRRWWPAGVALALLLAIGAGAYALFGHTNQQAATKPNSAATSSSNTTNYNVTSVPLSELVQSGALSIGTGSQLNVNGQLRINDSAVLVPTTQPNNPQTGQLWLNSANNQLYYYNGSAFVPVADDNTTVKSIGGSSGTLAVGSGLSSAGNTLQNTGVLSVQGQTGTVNFSAGGGITLNGTVISTTALPANQLVLGTGSSGFGAVAAPASPGLCLVSTAGAPVFGSCTGAATVNTLNGLSGTVTISAGSGLSLAGSSGNNIQISSTGGTGVTSVNSVSGAIFVDNSTMTGLGGNHVTIDTASTSALGLVKVDGTNIVINGGGVINTAQAIGTGASPTFAALTLTAPLTVANGGTGRSTFTQHGVLIGDNTNGLNVVAAGAGGQCFMSQTGADPIFQSCPVGGNVSASNPQTPGRLTKFGGTTNTITDSIIGDDGLGTVTVYGNLTVAGGSILTGNGSGLTNVNAATLNGQADTYFLNATNLASGTVSIARGGTGLGTLTDHGLLIGHGTGNPTFAVDLGGGLCLMSNLSADPAFQTCPVGGNVTATSTHSAGFITMFDTNGVDVTNSVLSQTSGNLTSTGTLKIQSTSTTAFQIQNAASSGNLFIADTTNGLVGIGQAPTTAGGLGDVRLQVDGGAKIVASVAITADAAHNGTIYFDPSSGTNGQFKIIEDGVAKTLCNTVNQGCGAGTAQINLQSAYSGGTDAKITTADARDLEVKLANTTTDSNFLVNILSGSTGYFAVQNAGNDVFAVNTTGAVLGKSTSTDGSLLFNSQGSAFTTEIKSGTPGSNVVLTLPNDDGNASDCLKSNGSGVLSWGTCVSGGSGGGITGTGTATFLPVFDSAQNLVDSIISQPTSTNINIAGTLNVTDGSSLVLGTSSVAGKTGAIVFKNATNANTITLQSGSAGTAPSSSYALSLPQADTAGCLSSDGAGHLSFTTCLSGGGGGGGVTFLNGNAGTVTITGDPTKGLTVSGNAINPITVTLAQDIQATASPTFVTVNATTGLNTGAGTGTQRIDSSGNLLNIGNITASAALNINATGANNISIGGVSTGDILLGGGFGATGCTVTNSNGNLQCNGSINGSALSGGSLSNTQVNGVTTANICTTSVVCSGYQAAGSYLTSAVTSLQVNTSGNLRTGGINLIGNTGVTISDDGSGNFTFQAPGSGTCAGCANLALGNLSGVAINTSLLPASGNFTVDLGAAATPFRNLYLGTSATASAKFDSSGLSAARIYTLPNAGGTLAVSATGNIALDAAGNITFTGQLPIANGGTGANSAATARSNLGAAASGSNSDITTLTGLTSINNSSALTIGNTGQTLALQGGASTSLSATSGGIINSLVFATPASSNKTITIPNETGTLCTTGSICSGYQASGTYLTSAVTSLQVNTSGNLRTGGINLVGNTGVTISDNGSGTFTFTAPGSGTCASCANQQLSNISSTQIGSPLQATNGSGANNAGTALTLAGGQGTGTAAGGNIILQVAKGGTAGSSLNALATVASISGTDGSALFKNATDSTTAFQVRNVAAQNLLSIDTLNNNITVGGNNSAALKPWASAGSAIGATRNFPTSVVANGYVYVIGGSAGGGATTEYAKINSNGTLGTWTATQSMGTARYQHTSVVANGYIYAIGGYSGGVIATTERAKLNADGTLGAWTSAGMTSMGTTRFSHTSVAANGWVYAIGGNNGAGNLATTERAKLNADGTLNAWTSVGMTSMGTARLYHTSVVANGYVYAIGGNTAITTSEYARLNSDGTLGNWSSSTSMLNARYGHASVVANGYIYAIGGFDGSGYVLTTEYASTQRVQVGGALDLVGLGGANLADGETGTGGELTAGNTNIVGALQVQGQSSFARSVTINGALNAADMVAFKNATNSTTAFQVQNSSGTDIFTVDTTNAKVGTADSTTASTNALTIKSGNASVGTNLSSGAVTIDSGTATGTGTAGNISIGTGAYAHNTTIGNTTLASALNLQSGTGGINLSPSGSSNTGVTVRPTTADSTNAFQVQNAAAQNLLSIDTLNNNIKVGGNNSGALTAWTPGSNMGTGRHFFKTVTSNGYVYAIGGYNGSVVIATTEYAKINTDGTLGNWVAANPMGTIRSYHSAVVANGYVYAIGGSTNMTTPMATTERAKINADGTLGAWTAVGMTSMGTARQGHASIVANGYVYAIGGDSGGAGMATTERAKINADGTLGAWTAVGMTSMGTARTRHTSVAANGYVYAIGGAPDGFTPVTTTERAKINADGTLGAWTAVGMTSMGTARTLHTSVVSNGYVYSMGTGIFDNTVEYARLNSDGTLSAWAATAPMGTNRFGHGSIVVNGYIYSIGGIMSVATEYASTQRVKVGGALDLVGLGGANLADGETGTGGELTAGNTNIVGSLQVQGQSSFARSVTVNGVLSASDMVAFKNTTNSTTAFQVQNSSGVNLVNANTTNMTLTVNSSASAASFASYVDYATGTSPTGVASADVNGDGRLDLVVANGGSANISVFINNGSGTYLAGVTYATGTTPNSVAIADVNGDGKPDIATVNGGISGVGTTASVLINNGNGTYAAAVTYTVGTGPTGIALADVNGDGKPDMATANQTSQNASVLLNNGTGTFLAQTTYTTGAGSDPWQVAIGDVNGDGRPDMVTSDTSTNMVSVFFNSGNGAFAAKNDYATNGTGPRGLFLSDVNGDGKLDILTANSTANTASVLINSGTGTFPSNAVYAAGTGAFAVTAGDVNGDGKPDMIVSNNAGNAASVYINSGTGTFAAKVDFATSGNPRFLITSDVNGDGKQDIVAANSNPTNTASILLNTGNGIVVNGYSSLNSVNLTAGSTLYSKGNVILQNATDSTTAFQIQNSSGTNLFKADTTNSRLTVGGDLLGASAPTAVTTTTTGVGGSNVTSISLTSASTFANGDVIFVDNTGGSGQDYFTRILTGGGTTTLTLVSPPVSYGTAAGYTGNATITKYTTQNIGSIQTSSATPSLGDRFFQGYFLGGVVVGAGSTTLSDGILGSTTAMNFNSPSFTFKPTADSATAFRVQNAAGTSLITADTTASNVSVTSSTATGTGMNVTANSLTTGTGLSVSSASTSLTSANLVSINQSNTVTTASTTSGNALNVSRTVTSSNAPPGSLALNTTPASTGNGGTSISQTIAAGSNRILVVVSWSYAPTTWTVGATVQNFVRYGSTPFYYVASPTTGSGTVALPSCFISCSASTWNNADLNNPFANYTGTSGSGTQTFSVATSTGDYVLAIGRARGGSYSLGAGTGMVLMGSQGTWFDPDFFSFFPYNAEGSYYRPATGSSTQIQFTTGFYIDLAYAVALKTAPGPPSPITGAAASISSSCVYVSSYCTDTSNVLNLNQQYTGATGPVLAFQNAGTGADIQLSAVGLVQSQNQTANSTNSTNITIRTGNASGTTSNSGSITIDSGTATGTAGTVSIGTGAFAHDVVVGNATGTSSVTLQGGSGGVNVVGDTLTSGNAFNVSSASANVTSGNLARINQNPTYTLPSSIVTGNTFNVARSPIVNVTTSPNVTLDATGGNSSSSWPHTVTSAYSNRVLTASVNGWVNAGWSESCTATYTAPGYSAQSMTRLTANPSGSAQHHLVMFGLVNPNPGAGTIALANCGATGYYTGSSSFYNVDVSGGNATAFTGATSTFAANPSIPISGLTTKDMVVDAYAGYGTTITRPAGQNPYGGNGQHASWKVGTGSPTTVSLTSDAGAVNYGAVGIKSMGATGGPTILGSLASLTSSCTVTSGSCTDSSNILNLNQQYSGATGAVLAIQNAGTGADIQLSKGTIQTAATNSTSTNSTGVSLMSGNALGATSNSGNITIDSGTATGTTGNIYIGNANATLVQIGNTSATLGTWNNNTGYNLVVASVSQPRVFQGSAVYNGYAYVVGGIAGSGVPSATNATNTVYYARLKADGTIPTSGTGIWTATTAISVGGIQNRYQHSVVASNGYLYVMGGIDELGAIKQTAYYAKINADGTVGSWAATSSIGVARASAGSFAANGYVYMVGGSTTNGGAGAVSTTYYARQNADGTLGAWATTQPIGGGSPVNRFYSSVVYANGYIYVIGGMDASPAYQSTVYYAKLNTDGTIPSSGSGSWATTSPIVVSTVTQTRAYASAVVSNGNIYLFGGQNGSGSLSTAYTVPISSDGTLGTWTATTSLAAPAHGLSVVVANGYFYAIAGYNSNGPTIFNTVYYSSSPRVKVAGNLDLIGLDNSGLTEGGAGGQLTAGNTRIVGTFDVSDQANFMQGVSIGGNLTVGGKGTNANPVFAVQNSNGQSLLSVDTANNNIKVGENNSAELQTWTANANSIAAARSGVATVIAKGYMYVLGGDNAGPKNDIYYAKINANGSTSTFTTSAVTLPASLTSHSAVYANGYIYVIGGYNGTTGTKKTYYTKVNTDGSLGTWSTNAVDLATNTYLSGVAAANGYLYVVGGWDGSAAHAETYYGRMNGDGSISSWTATNNIGAATTSGGQILDAHSVVVANGYLYAIGGTNGLTTTVQSNVYYARLNADGTVGAWATNGTTLTSPRSHHQSVVANGALYVIGGYTTGGTTAQQTVFAAPLSNNGSVGTFTQNTNLFNTPVRADFGSATANGYIYVVAGQDSSGTGQSGVQYASTQRLQVGGSLDLVGFSSGTLADPSSGSSGSVGGSLTAGDTNIVGALQVQGQATFAQGVAIGGNLNVGGDAAIVGTLKVTGAVTLSSTLLVSGAATFSDNITVNGHIIAGGSAPTFAVQTGAGTGASCDPDSTSGVTNRDTAGGVTIVAGTSAASIDTYCRITFATSYGNPPHVLLSTANDPAGQMGTYATVAANGSYFDINFHTAGSNGVTYKFNYFVIK